MFSSHCSFSVLAVSSCSSLIRCLPSQVCSNPCGYYGRLHRSRSRFEGFSGVFFPSFPTAPSPCEKWQKVRSTTARAQVESSKTGNVARGDKLLLVGLGNPGPQFDNTRHNIGFMVVTEFATRNKSSDFKLEKRFQAEVSVVRVGVLTIHVLRPRTFMNNSGAAVRAIMDFYKIPKSAILVVADDMALELGRVRLRAKGSAGGHNGLRSVEKHVGGTDYMRLKVGVGCPSGGAHQWSDHVLGKFTRGDMKLLDEAVWNSLDIIEEWTREADVGRIMNAFNLKNSAT